MPRRAAAWLAALISIGCQDTLQFELPPTEGARSLILILVDGSDLREAHAVDLSGTIDYPELKMDRGRDLSLHAAAWPATLEDLRIAPGPIDLQLQDAPPGPTPDEAYVIQPGHQYWEPAAEVPPVWARLRVPRIARVCTTWRTPNMSPRPVPGSSGNGGWMAYHFGRTMIGSSAGVWDVRTDSTEVDTVLDSTITSSLGLSLTSTGAILAGYQSPEGPIYLFTRGGGFYRAEDEGERFTRLPDAPGATLDASYAWMAGPDEPRDQLEIVVLDSNGSLWRYDEDGWQTLLEADPARPLGWRGGVDWTGDGSWLVVGPGEGRVLRVQGVSVTEETIPGLERATAVEQVFSHGLFIGDNEGRLWRSEANLWTRVDAPATAEVRLIHSMAQGVVYGGADGQLRYFSDTDPGCHGILDFGETVIEVSGGSGRFSRRGYNVLSSSGYSGPAAQLTLTRVSF